MENIISEVKVIETDDGFRIEIKGDKEKIKSFMSDFGDPKGWPRHHRRGYRWGPFGFGFHPMMWMKMASCWGPWDYEVEKEESEEA